MVRADEGLRLRFEETRLACARGWYERDGRRVELADALAGMRRGTRLFTPEELRALPAAPAGPRAVISVTGESTLVAAVRLAAGGGDVAALNFASARTPGGGVLKGAVAQEEDLARASALHDSLTRCPAFYAAHRAEGSPWYSDRVLYSPRVPVFRDDRGGWLPTPVPVTFLTCAAPNRRRIEAEGPVAGARLARVLAERARGVLAVAAHGGHRRLVLGAWGCGVFGNDPRQVAGVFAELLTGDGPFAAAFERVVFAVLDRAGPTRAAFAETFLAA
ncbi:TIGR02452 family protein [Streptomyces sp. DSM 44915]|uniref:TIGR02452 family protein n=1 Tax=Streptomyces chisholmiae TaxID=3075540 RepID=A0ABU2JPG6_9ACTN|nr:TIGR02452 family protein [Streptomyces sp. DSM 44915]MDT0266883.1 TIGR02452 family protein [Streptomyces sp. DSM 44915]